MGTAAAARNIHQHQPKNLQLLVFIVRQNTNLPSKMKSALVCLLVLSVICLSFANRNDEVNMCGVDGNLSNCEDVMTAAGTRKLKNSLNNEKKKVNRLVRRVEELETLVDEVEQYLPQLLLLLGQTQGK